ncbi:MAG: RnfABCDGE type electron transport complex subunit B [Bacteroidaceae bacterium]|nr:RnfABCDGE type electron transport complex subunit B [Bacteroidaceae bacterium]
MPQVIVLSLILLGSIGLIVGLILFFVSKAFAVETDQRIARIESLLPNANCGGCGLPGCSAYAAKAVEQGSLDGLVCNACTAENRQLIASILGSDAEILDEQVAVLRCNGTCSNRVASQAEYDGTKTCAIANMSGAGQWLCSYGCLGYGDCTNVCSFGAITVDAESGVASVNPDVCTGCGACVKSCPRGLLMLAPKTKPQKRIWVACANRDKGPVARKSCSVACIGCGKCAKDCSFNAITISDNLAWINPKKCFLCGKCVENCPTKAIKLFE